MPTAQMGLVQFDLGLHSFGKDWTNLGTGWARFVVAAAADQMAMRGSQSSVASSCSVGMDLSLWLEPARAAGRKEHSVAKSLSAALAFGMARRRRMGGALAAAVVGAEDRTGSLDSSAGRPSFVAS